jgi:DNA-binding SARP family transcriptional activator
VEFRVLGPLEVVDGEEALPLRGGRCRALLALLLLHANEVVSVDRLIDDLWGERAPPSAGKIVQVYVSDLRKTLGGNVLVTRSPGYLLRIEAEQVDAFRFEQLLGRARNALARGAAEDASRTLGEALGLWRGPALVDFGFESFAQAEITRLEDLRLAALEQRIEADLELGLQEELVPELETLVVRFPLRERLRGQLMLALYRSGRQAEALHVYQDARRALIEELGIEPGQALHQLERRILQQDESLSRPTAFAAGPPGAGLLVTVMSVELEATAELGAGRGDDVARRVLDARTRAIPGEIERYGGRRMDALGGGLTATFPSARAGVACAVALQRLLAEEPGLHIRIGLNLGETPPDPSQPFGAVLSAARVAAGAAPDEILVTEAVKHLAGVASDLAFLDRGPVEVEGFPEPWRLHAVVWAQPD